ncbi:MULTISPECIES: (d)CMP kinase [Clostridium]|uniref:Cytidylate kinase n=3 Tax=Clostridium TaxID=1485 RepID=D8GJN2_CLOLD|nr:MULTISPECIES: (d)CMP kinase [Clostridium]ADK15193.1 cytidylate kinase [Clostridium ljungdahlii DSM 13528]AGY74452.1 (d)CMP kinase [Clostridium autoethanogenum DSM 10061]ALU34640.1 Cytidylate kinase [Clostridium autoethanogenum DSM 10061]OAA88673.1 Cytidylate kinase [Clostridium ljungdahlii DSM 13528]OVY51360.1 Cytidylate kinase [Clostridium autoethanogenum]
MKISVAIDGPAAAGKSTIANIVAQKFNFMYINTGAMYRAVTLMCIRQNISYTDVNRVCEVTKSLKMHFEGEKLIVNGEDLTESIKHPTISNTVSNYAAISDVRKLLVKLQQQMAGEYNVIMDGRDIGSVVLKNAPLKFFLTASPEERAKRRYNELSEKNISVNYDEILNDIIKRDHIDSHRSSSPFVKAEDAVEIDSSFLSLSEVVQIISSYIKKYIEEHR